MDYIKSSDLKTILHSKRANLYYLEHCRVLVHGGRVEYVTEEGKDSLYWNIPIANTTFILLGEGTSISQAAMRKLAEAGVMVGFCGSGGTPLFSAHEIQLDISWLVPQSEYRPTGYLQQWVRFWFDDHKRLKAAKELQLARFEQVERQWLSPKLNDKLNFPIQSKHLKNLVNENKEKLQQAQTIENILQQEAIMTKALYKLMIKATDYGDFTRAKRGTGTDAANRHLDYGNYLAYGLAAIATWVLGLPHGLAVLHGKTRRGGLVFDIADIIKDSLILPQAFISAMNGDDNATFRQHCIENFTRTGALDIMIDTIKTIIENINHEHPHYLSMP